MRNKTTILFYFENRELAKKFANIEINQLYFDSYKLVFSYSKLTKFLNESKEYILFVVFPKMSIERRLWIRKLHKEYIDLPIVLCSQSSFALDAWKFDLLHFLSFPVKDTNITFTLKKYLRMLNIIREEPLKLRYNGGTSAILPKNILYCKAEGNYTRIYFKSKQNILVIYKIKQIEDKTATSMRIERIGKSFIINLNNIKRIEKTIVTFYADYDAKLELSQNYAKRVRELF